jgi:plastocyanin
MANRSTRRRVLGAIAGTATIGTLAGCSESGNGDDGGDEEMDDGNGGAEETDTEEATETEPTPEPETVRVGPDAQNVFEPDTLEIPVGTTVTFVWESSGHSLLVDSKPEGSEWAGVSETQSEGYEHSHTFEVPGTYEYYCEPHQGFGMEGSITVTE